jgi:hypothetical protein
MTGADYALYGAAGAAIAQGASLLIDLQRGRQRGKGWPWQGARRNVAVILGIAIHIVIGGGIAWLLGVSGNSPFLLASAGAAAPTVVQKMLQLGEVVYGKERQDS